MNTKEKRRPRPYQQAHFPLLSDEHWRHLAACAGADGDMFFSDDRAASMSAQRMCDACPVALECRDHAEQTPERFGMWGGVTAGQRGWNTAGAGNRRRHRTAP
ncbi:WhiB family transcriptional regulator [Streptomyces sp. NPDC001774]